MDADTLPKGTFIIHVKASSILTQTRLTYKNKFHFYPI